MNTNADARVTALALPVLSYNRDNHSFAYDLADLLFISRVSQLSLPRKHASVYHV